MDWAEAMNQAVDYLEAHLTEKPDGAILGRITACTYGDFQRAFRQVSGVSVSEYLRRRRLTLAAYDLQNTWEKVLDIALKYGYDSADAFCVAFKRLHGITPSEARTSGVKLTFYCRLRFELTVSGIQEMRYRSVRRGAFKVLGRRQVTPYGAGTWAVILADGSAERIEKLSGHFCDLGLCFGFHEDGSNDYMCAVEWEGEDVPDLESYTYEPADWLVFDADGTVSGGTLGAVWQRINREFLPQSKYRKAGPTIEKYLVWDETADICRVEIWIMVAIRTED